MYEGQTVLSQLMRYLPLRIFRQCVARYQGDHRIKQFKCLDQFRCMAFAQLTYRESLRDIQACLRAMHPKLYHTVYALDIHTRSTNQRDYNATRPLY